MELQATQNIIPAQCTGDWKLLEYSLREALLTLEGGVKLVFPSVRPCVRPSVREDNNCFLRRVYEPTTHAGTHWQFEIMILEVFKKNISKSQVKP